MAALALCLARTGARPGRPPALGDLTGRARGQAPQWGTDVPLTASRCRGSPGLGRGSATEPFQELRPPVSGLAPSPGPAPPGTRPSRASGPTLASPHPPPVALWVCSGLEDSENGKYLLPTGEGKYCPMDQAEVPDHRCQEQMQSGEPAWRQLHWKNVLSVWAPEGQTSWLWP